MLDVEPVDLHHLDRGPARRDGHRPAADDEADRTGGARGVDDDVEGHRPARDGQRRRAEPDVDHVPDVEHHQPRRGRVAGEAADGGRPVAAGRAERGRQVAETGEPREPEELGQVLVPPVPVAHGGEGAVVGERLDRRRREVEHVVVLAAHVGQRPLTAR